MKQNHLLVVVFIPLLLIQTGVPIIGQKMTKAIVYPQLFQASIAVCIAVAASIGIWQMLRQPFGKIALAAFYIGLSLLLIFDFWMDWLIGASV